jgi:hypothetical protein
MRLILALVISGLFGPTAPARAANYTVDQKGRTFSSEITSFRKGQAVTVLNDETVLTAYFRLPMATNSIWVRRVRVLTDVTFKKVDEVEVICAIHPRMKMNLLD